MGNHITRYKTENGKTYKVGDSAVKPADENTASGKPGAENKNNTPGTPADKERKS